MPMQLVVSYVLMERFMRKMQWKGQNERWNTVTTWPRKGDKWPFKFMHTFKWWVVEWTIFKYCMIIWGKTSFFFISDIYFYSQTGWFKTFNVRKIVYKNWIELISKWKGIKCEAHLFIYTFCGNKMFLLKIIRTFSHVWSLLIMIQ